MEAYSTDYPFVSLTIHSCRSTFAVSTLDSIQYTHLKKKTFLNREFIPSTVQYAINFISEKPPDVFKRDFMNTIKHF